MCKIEISEKDFIGCTFHMVVYGRPGLVQPRAFSAYARVGISGTTAKSRQRKFVPSSHPGPFALVASSRKSQTKLGTAACFDFLLKNEQAM